MKRAVMLHGTDGHPSHNWQPWLKNELEQHGYEVWAPELPENHTPNRSIYNSFLFGSGWDFHDNLLVGHSSGTTSILNLLLDDRCPKVKAIVFVSTFFEMSPQLLKDPDFTEDQFENLFPAEGFDFDKIKQKCDKFYFVHGDNDDLCPIELAQKACDILEGKFMVVKGGGHLGGSSSITKLPMIVDALAQDTVL